MGLIYFPTQSLVTQQAPVAAATGDPMFDFLVLYIIAPVCVILLVCGVALYVKRQKTSKQVEMEVRPPNRPPKAETKGDAPKGGG